MKQTKNTDHVCPHTFVSLNVAKRPKVCADIAAVCYRPLKQSSTFLSDRPGRLKILFRFTVMDMITDTGFLSTSCPYEVDSLLLLRLPSSAVRNSVCDCTVSLVKMCVCRAGPFKCLRKQIQLLNQFPPQKTHTHTPGFCSVHLHPVPGSSFNFESMNSMMGKQMFDSSTADQIV